MREDIYGPKLWAIINKATEPVTAAALTKQAGCSKQRTYQWLQQARDQGVIEVGRNTRGAALFSYQAPRATERRAGGTGAGGSANKKASNRAGAVVVNGLARDAAMSGTLARATTTLSIDPRSMLGVDLQVTGVRLSTDGGYVLELAGDEGVCIQIQVDAAPGADADGASHATRPVAATAKN